MDMHISPPGATGKRLVIIREDDQIWFGFITPTTADEMVRTVGSVGEDHAVQRS